MIVQVNLVRNRTVVDSDWRFDNLCGSHLQTKFTRTILLNLLMKFVICCSPFKMWMSAKLVTPARMEPLVSTPWVDTAAGALQITRENTAMKVRKIGIISCLSGWLLWMLVYDTDILLVKCFASFIDVNECAVKNPCKNGAKCENTRGGYNCNCVGKWFTGKHCDQGLFS